PPVADGRRVHVHRRSLAEPGRRVSTEPWPHTASGGGRGAGGWDRARGCLRSDRGDGRGLCGVLGETAAQGRGTVLSGRWMPSGPVLLILGICIGMSGVYWYAGGRKFDIWFWKVISSAKESSKRVTWPPPPPRPRPDSEREAALRALQEARAAIAESRE